MAEQRERESASVSLQSIRGVSFPGSFPGSFTWRIINRANREEEVQDEELEGPQTPLIRPEPPQRGPNRTGPNRTDLF
ncbi:Hypothetical predicted protein [Xyrichtys novacula]|uniref:Uncharacterized protein n=1 Tax=Xyrichtys novacula TaxID=13765 RepID=A0AAV1HQL9_XYRNO|nr:Hypothetical predicted protein [Xyrichtys novacula]